MNRGERETGTDQPEPRSAELDTVLADSLSQLREREQLPQTDLWPAIRARIEEPGRTDPERSWLAWAAVLVLSLGLGGLVWLFLASQPDGRTIDLGSTNTFTDLPPGSSASLLEAFELHQAERESLVRALSRSLDDYPPELRVEIENNLRTIADAMGQIESSLRSAGPTEDEEQRLAALFDFELRLLRSLHDRLNGWPGGGVSAWEVGR